MEYYEAVNYITDLKHSRMKLGTETTAAMLDHLGNPHEGVAFVQVAGSNGKGSTARMLESILRSAGLTVGLYTSPDLSDIRERITIDGRKIRKETFRSFVERIRPFVAEQAATGDSPTHFEVLTVLALATFGERDVDVAVLEVGIGGRYDATSVVDPVGSAVTTVSLEHTDLLGDTVGEIARDKVQVAPADAPLVTGATGEALATIREETDTVTVGADGTDVTVTTNGLVSSTEQSISIDGPDWSVDTRLRLMGDYQAVNAGIAATLARQVTDVPASTVADGLWRARWPGRFEVMDTDPFVVLDGAHNPDACAKLADLVERYDFEDRHVVFGAMNDKDHERMVTNLPEADTMTLCRPDVGRAESVETLKRVVNPEPDTDVAVAPSVLAAVDRVLEMAETDDFVLVTGSLYTVAEARDRWMQPRARITSRATARETLSNTDVASARTREIVDSAAHRTIRACVRPAQAERLKEVMLSLGGTAAVSGIENHHQPVDIVLNGSVAQLDRLVERIDDGSRTLSHVADQIRSLLHPDASDGNRTYPWESGTVVMGILNVTTDSFYDGGTYVNPDDAVDHAVRMVRNGADIVDVGGESTRPGADPVTESTEIDRIMPVLDRLRDLDAFVSVDTRKPGVAETALEAGADMINDVSGLDDPTMADIVARHDVPVVVMHSVETPVASDRMVGYDDVVDDILRKLTERVAIAERAGIDRSNIVVDPGIGFGKTAADSFELVDRLEEFRSLGCPVLVGHSHKSMFASIDCEFDERLWPTVAVSAMAAERGADIVRVHDVKENVAAVRAATATKVRTRRGIADDTDGW